MIVFPDNMKTWIIGDGYGANPYNDPYYIGPAYHGFYMGTDIGYLRFIFFFGILGMFSMIAMFIGFYRLCCNRFATYKNMILLLLVLNLIIWCKVTSDLLPVFAMLLCVSKEENDDAEQRLLING
jgi:O-antigen ligase